MSYFVSGGVEKHLVKNKKIININLLDMRIGF